jgi:Cohesin domain
MRLFTKVMVAFLGLTLGVAQAQPRLDLNFSPTQVSGTVGSTIEVVVTAAEFTDIVGYQYTLVYDATKILAVSLISDEELFSAQLLLTNYNLAQPGLIRFSWYDINGPISLAPNTELFRLYFDVLETGNTEICVDPNLQPLKRAFSTGNVTAEFVTNLCQTTTSTATVGSDFNGVSVVPNPLVNSAQLTFSMPSAKAVELNIVNVLGQQVVSRVIDAQEGGNTYALDRDIFPVAGLYYVTLQHQQGRSVYPLWVH